MGVNSELITVAGEVSLKCFLHHTKEKNSIIMCHDSTTQQLTADRCAVSIPGTVRLGRLEGLALAPGWRFLPILQAHARVLHARARDAGAVECLAALVKRTVLCVVQEHHTQRDGLPRQGQVEAARFAKGQVTLLVGRLLVVLDELLRSHAPQLAPGRNCGVIVRVLVPRTAQAARLVVVLWPDQDIDDPQVIAKQ